MISNKQNLIIILQMHHLCSLSHHQTPSPTTRNTYYFLFNPNNKTNTTNHGYHRMINHGYHRMIRRNNNTSLMRPKRDNSYLYYRRWIISAIEDDSKEFEVDPDKARQALSDLDQQLESLSVKQVNPPKIRASSIGNLKERVKNEPPEISGSFLGYTAFVLFMFSVFYNILFITFIKPSIDGPDEDIVATDVTKTYQVPDVSQPLQ